MIQSSAQDLRQTTNSAKSQTSMRQFFTKKWKNPACYSHVNCLIKCQKCYVYRMTPKQSTTDFTETFYPFLLQ